MTRQGLSSAELAAIAELADACNRYDGTDLKLNWDMLRTRPAGETNDFLYYADGRLVGFLGLYGLGKIEVTGMVHPANRRRGVFRALFAAARAECLWRGLPSLILVTEAVAPAGRAFALAHGAPYITSEYRMLRVADAPPPLPPPRLRLAQAGPAEVDRMAYITAVAFGMELQAARQRFAHEVIEPDRRCYLAWRDDLALGTINAILEDSAAYIHAFAVLPAYRGQGYGREILARTLATLHTLGHHRQTLEVACDNEYALALYHSCGFQVTTTYDYYELALYV